MKQFAITAVAVFIGVVGALLLYDALVLKPREAALAQTLSATAKVELARAREDAKGIADDLDTAVNRTVADAERAMQEQASEQERRRLAIDALNRAAMFKLAISETYLSTGKWPTSAAQAGLAGTPASHASGAVARIEIGAQGLLIFTLGEPFASDSKIRLTPRAHPQNYSIDWKCSIEGDATLSSYLPACKS